MSKITIFQETFLVSGIMCFDGCGNIIQNALQDCFIKYSDSLPSDAKLLVDAEPNGLGIQRLIISIETEENDFDAMADFHSILAADIKENLVFDVIDESSEVDNTSSDWKHWINIFINLASMVFVISCALIFPPSILLTIAMAACSFLTTAFTAREYLFGFFRNLRAKQFSTMTTTVSLGWLLSLGHTVVHSIAMPLLTHFSMVFMNFIMPSILITCINGVDEIKRRIMEKSKKIQLKGLKTLFPQMSDTYLCGQLSEDDRFALDAYIDDKRNAKPAMNTILETLDAKEEEKKLLTKGMLIRVNAGECFPVDGILVDGNTVIDASILTGEPQQGRKPWESIPAGAINLGQAVMMYALKNPYNSTVNSLLFRSNRARSDAAIKAKTSTFTYLYLALIILGIAGAVIMPFAFGVISISLVVQNMIGILFSICPCTIAIAHELPKLLSIHQRNKKNIHLRDDGLLDSDFDATHTLVFDKTGTLTTSHSIVESSNIEPSSPLWHRIYLLEKSHGCGHPLANAITQFYEENHNKAPLFNDIINANPDKKNRGIAADVQGNHLWIGSYDYLLANGIVPPKPDASKTKQGCSSVYVAENGKYKGIIYIQHQIRPGVVEVLTKLKQAGKKIIMLTGDTLDSATGFNQRINGLFDEIHAKQTPQDKENFLNTYMDKSDTKSKGVWFCGDGLNDAPCCRAVSEKGGISCAISSNDKSAFFTDMSLNGRLDYLLKHTQVNRHFKQIINQNKGILIYSTLAFLAFIISFSIAGIAVSPLIPVAIMVTTTLGILFNSYRVQLAIDNALDTITSWPKKILASNVSIGLLLAATFLIMSSVLVATLATGVLALPVIAFTSGIAIFSSICSLSAISLLSGFGLLLTAFLLFEPKPAAIPLVNNKQSTFAQSSLVESKIDNTYESHHHSIILKPSPSRSIELLTDERLINSP